MYMLRGFPNIQTLLSLMLPTPASAKTLTISVLQEKTGATRSGQPGLDNPILKDIDMMPGMPALK